MLAQGPEADGPGGSSSSGSSGVPEFQDYGDDGNSSKEEPWTIQGIVAVISGFIGSFLSVNAYNNQRVASKAGVEGSSPGRSQAARIVQQLGGSLLDAEAESPLFALGAVPPCTPASDLRLPGRHFTIITTAALPWRTGTAVNPLLRALNLAKVGRPTVLVLPWLDEGDQSRLFPNGTTFSSSEAQEEAIRAWCRERANIDPDKIDLQFRWYPAKYVKMLGSIFPKGDCSKGLREGDPKDVLILEEPEHLCWYHHGAHWPTLFQHVIGIVHTNYSDYLGAKTLDFSSGSPFASVLSVEMKEATVFAASTLVCSAYCDVNIKLSDTIMPLPNEVTCNVHGVRDEFLEIGDRLHARREGSAPAYYIGKAVYEKGWRELLDYLKAAGNELGDLVVDGYGSGGDYDSIVASAEAQQTSDGAKLIMHPGLDHAEEPIHSYGVLVNPSTSDVLCTVTVEALAMGKQCVLARHPSNRFFEQFEGRCHFFQIGNPQSFVQAMRNALSVGQSQPLPAEQRQALTWDAASERLFDAAEVRVFSGPFKRPSEAAASRLAYKLHFDVMKDQTVLADLIREVSFGRENGQETPWDEYFSEWRKREMAGLRKQALQWRTRLEPRGGWYSKSTNHLQEHEQYLKDRVAELAEHFSQKKK